MSVDASTTADILGVRVTITGPDRMIAELRVELRELLRGDGVPALRSVDVELTPDGTLGDALATLTGVVVETSPLHCLHSGVVAGEAGLLVVPGQSGVGKTTAVAALVMRGFGYLSDEALAIDRASGLVHPFPRPLALSGASQRILGLDAGELGDEVESLIRLDLLGSLAGPGRASDILLISRRPGPVSLIEVADRGAAVAELLKRSFNHFADPTSSLRSVVELVRNARVWRATYEQAGDFAAAVADLVQAPADTIAK